MQGGVDYFLFETGSLVALVGLLVGSLAEPQPAAFSDMALSSEERAGAEEGGVASRASESRPNGPAPPARQPTYERHPFNADGNGV